MGKPVTQQNQRDQSINETQNLTQELQQMGDLDPDALAYIRAKRNVETLHKAKKQMTSIRNK